MSFAQAMQEASEVLEELESGSGDATKIEALLSTDAGARGFFVVFLTGTSKIADEPPTVLVDILRTASNAAIDVVTKNLVMAAATAAVHHKNKDDKKEAGSRRVTARVTKLIRLVNSDLLWQKLSEMRATLEGKSKAYEAFMDRVRYDGEQKSAALTAIDQVMTERTSSKA